MKLENKTLKVALNFLGLILEKKILEIEIYFEIFNFLTCAENKILDF